MASIRFSKWWLSFFKALSDTDSFLDQYIKRFIHTMIALVIDALEKSFIDALK